MHGTLVWLVWLFILFILEKVISLHILCNIQMQSNTFIYLDDSYNTVCDLVLSFLAAIAVKNTTSLAMKKRKILKPDSSWIRW